MRVAEQTRLYARYRFTRSTESLYQDGDLDRAGVGVRYRFNERWLLDQELSADLGEIGQGGATTQLVYTPRDAWRFAALYASFAEDLPLRARAAGIEGRQWGGEAAWERRDYRQEWLASINAWDFSDGNQRTAFHTAFGHAWEMRARREQRIYLEWSMARNTLDDAVYFNPAHDSALGVTHRTDFVYDTRFRRHVDHLYLSADLYSQSGYGTHPRWSLHYEQDYDFDNARAFVAGAGVARSVYDGKAETEWRLRLYYQQRF